MEAFEIGSRRELEPDGSGSVSEEALAQLALTLSDASILNAPEQEAEFLANSLAQLATAAKSGGVLEELVLRDVRKNTIVTHRDVGIGISQVLPVLVLAYGSRGKLLAMEQPEIHLHPALQAELGDVFIEAALRERKNTFILETHSEHLILRLMRRIREGKISPNDVGVVFVEPLARGSRFIELRIDEEGDFIDEWPGGFFEESFHEKFGGR
ncbi:MAG: AAA family ATPase [Gammaproteobacteria bacterium]|nr:AAA family ATPase [Gammaproteobacteria bacterium]